jgi:hypothetical protein
MVVTRERPTEGDEMADSYTVKHRDEFETMEGSGEATWRLARKGLGTSAFGFNLVEIGPGGRSPSTTRPGAARSSSSSSTAPTPRSRHS